MLRFGGVFVDPHHDFFFGVNLPLEGIGRVRDFQLRIASFNGGDHAAHGVDFFDVLPGFGLHLIGEGFHKVGTGQRIDRVDHARFFGQNLLRAQRDFHGVLGRQAKHFIQRIGVQ